MQDFESHNEQRKYNNVFVSKLTVKSTETKYYISAFKLLEENLTKA